MGVAKEVSIKRVPGLISSKKCVQHKKTKPLQDVRNHRTENRKETVSSETVSNHHRLYASRTSLNSKRNRR